MIEYIIILLLGLFTDVLVFHSNNLNPLNLHITEAGKHLNGVDHVSNPLKTLAECVKLAENIVLTEIEVEDE